MQPILPIFMRSLRNSIFLLLATSTLALASSKITQVTTASDSPALKIGNLVFISGQGTGSTETPDPNGAAMEEAFQKIRLIANQMGGDLGKVVKLTVYMADLPNDYPLLNQIVPKYFKKPYPTRSTVGVASLPRNHRIEIDAIMVLK